MDPAPATVLVVEDEPAIRSIARMVLTRAGYQVLTAEDGPDALAQFQAAADRIAVVVLDLNLPTTTGWKVFADLRRLRPGVRVIVMSGTQVEQLDVVTDREEPTAVLPKPFLPADLSGVVARVLARP